MKIGKRPAAGRGVFYTRDSGGEHETTPPEYVRWAQREAEKLGVSFKGTPEDIDTMIRQRTSYHKDIYLDYCVKGNQLSREGLDRLQSLVLQDSEVSHVFIPRRDRLARPDDPLDGIKLETVLRQSGVTLVFMDRVLPPLPKGKRRDPAELIASMLDYDQAGRFRRDLAEKIIYAQIRLARNGFSTGGRAPFGFRRWLAIDDGTPVRLLEDREHVRKPGHHVIWLPHDDELKIVRRILEMLETMPASRVAKILTEEGVPTPDAGRQRTDGGVRHTTSGVWHQPTITSIARNPLLRALTTYGRRSMGDQLRFGGECPRELSESDWREDEKPKVTANSENQRIIANAHFEPLVEEDRHTNLIKKLDERAGTQRGKPRAHDPSQNPLGSRVFDLSCGWPMYRQPYNKTFRYLCGLYQQSHAGQCKHNLVDGILATRFLLGCIRQNVLWPEVRAKLEQRIRRIAKCELADSKIAQAEKTIRAELVSVRLKLQRAGENLALAANEKQFEAIKQTFDQLTKRESTLEQELEKSERKIQSSSDIEREVGAAMRAFDCIEELAASADNLRSIGQLFDKLNARLFLRFVEIKQKKRTVNRLAGGVVTFGATPPPINLYEGPTGRRTLRSRACGDEDSGRTNSVMDSSESDREGQSLGNVNRGERI